jgi:hypothetical protein
LIRVQLTAEELVIAQFLKKNSMENWSKELVASRKLYEANVVQLLIDSLSLTKEDSVAAQKQWVYVFLLSLKSKMSLKNE